MKFNEVQACYNDIQFAYQHLKDDEELYVCVETYTHSLTTPYQCFMNIPEDNIIQVHYLEYKIIEYADIKNLYPYSSEAGQ